MRLRRTMDDRRRTISSFVPHPSSIVPRVTQVKRGGRMYPVIFNFGWLKVYSYGLMVAVSFMACSFLISKRVRILGQKEEFAWNLSFWLLIGGILGGRIVYILLFFRYFLENPGEIFMVWHGGLAWYGGFIGGFLSGILYLKTKKIPVLKALDLLAPYIALGQAIGRIGCLLNGCCYGEPALWGIYCPIFKEYLIPTQIFSSFSLILIFIILRFIQSRPHGKGDIFILYMLLYSLKRFFMEFLRGDSVEFVWGVSIFQIISLTVFLSALILWIIILSRNKKNQASA